MGKIILLIVILIAALGIITVSLVPTLIIRPKKKNADAEAEKKVQKIEKVRAKVLSRNCTVRAEGLFGRRTVSEFFVTFEDEEGDSFILSIDEESFDKLDRDQTGEIVFIDGNFSEFIHDTQENVQ